MTTGHKEEENMIMTGEKEWYAKAGRSPFAEDGFTPELMARIEAAADSNGKSKTKFRSGKNLGLTCLAALLLFGVLIWPLGEWDKRDYAAKLSSLWNTTTGAAVQPTTTPQTYNPPVGSAEFEINGLKYYMPLPLDRSKERAFAVETSVGIVWSPPPPRVDYLKPKYTHNTEPYTLYLTPKGHSELSANSAKRIYTFPLYAGGAQTYFDLGYLYGAGDYLLFSHNAYTLGAERKPNTGKFSVIDLRKAEAGELIVPRELLAFDSAYGLYKSFMAIDQDREELLLVDYTEDGKGGYTQHNKLYDIATGNFQVLTGDITTVKNERPVKTHYGEISTDTEADYFVAHYEVKGEQRSVEINMLTGRQWFYDWWYEEYGEKIDPSAMTNQ
ncbi:hypothetical protein AMQ84_13815 [Paenibacillus riograndensis]|uniref:Uncharacterized protein n=1 Tax=Paenibacillus riograndensis TaxID=483937 RepID=A0A132U0C9_9BACL|nr:hypothetical protein [Paenibacillus riograndensis]KWX77037.1 hypothetical protein AMQ84_13815 [Paenibacillus riograndensis]